MGQAITLGLSAFAQPLDGFLMRGGIDIVLFRQTPDLCLPLFGGELVAEACNGGQEGGAGKDRVATSRGLITLLLQLYLTLLIGFERSERPKGPIAQRLDRKVMLASNIRQGLFRVFAGRQGFGKFFECGYKRIHGGPFKWFIVNGW
jgi:hypothetical protein